MIDNCPLKEKPMGCASITFPNDGSRSWTKIEKCEYCSEAYFNGVRLEMGTCINPLGGFRCVERRLAEMEDYENAVKPDKVKVVAEFKTDKPFKPGMFVTSSDILGEWIKPAAAKQFMRDEKMAKHKMVVRIDTEDATNEIITPCPVCGKMGAKLISGDRYAGRDSLKLKLNCPSCSPKDGQTEVICKSKYLDIVLEYGSYKANKYTLEKKHASVGQFIKTGYHFSDEATTKLICTLLNNETSYYWKVVESEKVWVKERESKL